MKITFDGNELNLPGDKPIEIIVHRLDNIEYLKTNDENYIGIRLTKGDRNKKIEENNDIDKILNATQLLNMGRAWLKESLGKDKEDERTEGKEG